MDNLNNIKNLNNTDNTNNVNSMSNADRIDKALCNLDILNSFIQLITDYIDFKEVDRGKTPQENILATYYEINRNKQNMLNLCYESIIKISDTAELLENIDTK